MSFFDDIFSSGGFLGDTFPGLFGSDGGGGGVIDGGAILNEGGGGGLVQLDQIAGQARAADALLSSGGSSGGGGSAPAVTGEQVDISDTNVLRELTKLNTSGILGDFINKQRAPGGFLSPGQQQQEFGIRARSIVQQGGEQRRQLDSDLRGLNPVFANRANSQIDFTILNQLLDARSASNQESLNRNFQAELGLANATAAQDTAEQQGFLGALQFKQDLDTQLLVANKSARSIKDASKRESTTNLISAGIQGVATIQASN